MYGARMKLKVNGPKVTSAIDKIQCNHYKRATLTKLTKWITGKQQYILRKFVLANQRLVRKQKLLKAQNLNTDYKCYQESKIDHQKMCFCLKLKKIVISNPGDKVICHKLLMVRCHLPAIFFANGGMCTILPLIWNASLLYK